MTSQKHGSYDAEKQLPDNRMQPHDSGLNVWLQEQIIERLGEDEAQCLIQEATPHKEKRYAWMLERMSERGHSDLAEEYQNRKRSLEAQRRYRDKERELNLWRKLLPDASQPRYREHIQKQIAKCEKYLQERKKDDQSML